MRDDRETEDLLNPFHTSNIFDEFPIVLVPEISEEDKCEKLMLREYLLRIFTGIKG